MNPGDILLISFKIKVSSCAVFSLDSSAYKLSKLLLEYKMSYDLKLYICNICSACSLKIPNVYISSKSDLCFLLIQAFIALSFEELLMFRTTR